MTKRIFMFASLALAACGGAAQAPKSAAEPASAPGAAPPPQQGYPQPGAATAPSSLDARPSSESTNAPTGLPMTPVPPQAQGAPATAPRTQLRRDVEAAQRELELAASDCTAACRALGSMERATARLCTLEETQCEDVRVRLRRARERVRASCGGCSGGPSVDPDAPIPSK